MELHYRYFCDSDDEYRIVIYQGQIKLEKKDGFVIINSPIILNNGVVVFTDGKVSMPDGSTKTLREGEFI